MREPARQNIPHRTVLATGVLPARPERAALIGELAEDIRGYLRSPVTGIDFHLSRTLPGVYLQKIDVEENIAALLAEASTISEGYLPALRLNVMLRSGLLNETTVHQLKRAVTPSTPARTISSVLSCIALQGSLDPDLARAYTSLALSSIQLNEEKGVKAAAYGLAELYRHKAISAVQLERIKDDFPQDFDIQTVRIIRGSHVTPDIGEAFLLESLNEVSSASIPGQLFRQPLPEVYSEIPPKLYFLIAQLLHETGRHGLVAACSQTRFLYKEITSQDAIRPLTVLRDREAPMMQRILAASYARSKTSAEEAFDWLKNGSLEDKILAVVALWGSDWPEVSGMCKRILAENKDLTTLPFATFLSASLGKDVSAPPEARNLSVDQLLRRAYQIGLSCRGPEELYLYMKEFGGLPWDSNTQISSDCTDPLHLHLAHLEAARDFIDASIDRVGGVDRQLSF